MSTGFPESDAATAFARQRRRQAMTKLASHVRRRDDVTFMVPFEDVIAALGAPASATSVCNPSRSTPSSAQSTAGTPSSTAGSAQPRPGPGAAGRASPRRGGAGVRCHHRVSVRACAR
jgi:hypothetical protein